LSTLSFWNVEWPNCNTQRSYPFVEGQSLGDGSFHLPDDFIIDLSIPVSAGSSLDVSAFHLAQVGVFSSGVTVSFAYNGTVFSTISIPTSGFTEYTTYTLQGTGAFFDTLGRMTVGKLSSLLKCPGAWNFTVDTGRVVSTCIRPNLRAVSSIRIQNGGDISEAITGDIVLVAGQNILLGITPSTNTITFNAAENSYTAECTCENLDKSAPPITTINGVAPDGSGNITLIGTTCLEITTGTNKLTLNDRCADPCCDCRELEVISSDLDTMRSQMQTLENTASTLTGSVSQLSATILASKT